LTSQLVIINQTGVAAASDTLTTHQEPHGEMKTIPSNSKMHKVGQEHLVVVLHCGGVFLGGVQWETLAREWSLSLGPPLPHLDDYVSNFATWVADNYEIFHLDQTAMMKRAICQEFSDLFAGTSNPVTEVLQQRTADPLQMSEIEFEKSVTETLKDYMKSCFTSDPYGDLTADAVIKNLESAKIDVYDDFLEHTRAFGKFEFSDSFKKFLLTFASELLIRFVNTGGATCLNFIGFGTKDIMGGRIEIRIRSFYGGRLRFATDSSGSADPKDYPMWFPLAQQDAMASFMWGVDIESRNSLRDIALDIVMSKVKLDEKQIAEFIEEFGKRSFDFLMERFAHPLGETIDTLSIGSLTRLADMLVRIQSLRSASLTAEATVGGFIESLEITRDNGVQWHHKISLETHSIEDASHVFA
jgi:hypothetical protein